MQFNDLIKKYQDWTNKLVEARLKNGSNGRTWFTKAVEYTDELNQENAAKFYNRDDLNDEYVLRYEQAQGKDKKPYAYIQSEINAIYSCQKCFVMRHKTRLQYYRDDLAQKDYHTYSAVNIAVGKLQSKQQQADS